MKTRASFVLILFSLLISCGEKKKNAVEELREKVMAVHDEIMPKMGDIMKYKKQLNTEINDLIEAGAEENTQEIAELRNAVYELENSHEGMMNWMHQFNGNFDGMVEEEVMKYLNEQMTKIESVAKTTNSALANAEELLSD